MLFFLITCCFSFILFHKSLNLNPLPSWAFEMRLLSFWFWKDFSILPILTNSIKTSILAISSSFSTSRMLPKKKSLSTSKVESIDHIASSSSEMSILDLPDLVLECILEKLPPEGLCRMATVCSSLRDRCTSDHLWERHMENKWGRIVGISAFNQWKCHVDSRKGSIFGGEIDRSKGLTGFLAHLRPFALLISGFISKKKMDFLFDDSIMSFYLALESGKFWFPAQVYNRENGHVGFLLSCYDAELNYNRKTDTFQARYPPHGRRASPIESGVTWDRIRSSPVDNSPLDLHVSDGLNELQPGDQIEIQWRRNKEFPYGWWYGVVGHLETCEWDANYCRCRDSETLVLEFNQYTRGSRWRTMMVNRKEHREEGNEVDGFYGGIRKIHSSKEKSMWKKIWPVDILE